jgi:hypothetical protein
MNGDQAREILMLYRPGTPDEQDPELREALAMAERDPELARWFQAQQALTVSLRNKLKSTEVPAGLREQILSELKAPRILHLPPIRRLSVPALAAALFLLLGLLGFFYFRSPGNQVLASFRDRMVDIALRQYPRMDLQTSDLNQIRTFLTAQQAYGDYVLPPALETKAAGTGCVVLRPWHGKPVSMICFNSGAQKVFKQKADLFLFIIDRTAVPITSASPKFAEVTTASTVTWAKGDKTYLLVAEGDKQFLKKFAP